MGRLDAYQIDLGRQTDVSRQHTFVLDNDYFALMEGVDIQKGRLTATVDVQRLTANTFSLTFRIQGQVTVICDRCLDEMQQPIDTTDHLTVRLGQAFKDEGDDTVVIPQDHPTLNIAWFVYEFIALAVPMKHVHPTGQCNPGMAKRLGQFLCNAEDDPADDSAVYSADRADAPANPLAGYED